MLSVLYVGLVYGDYVDSLCHIWLCSMCIYVCNLLVFLLRNLFTFVFAHLLKGDTDC